MVAVKRQKLTDAGAAGELRIIEQFGRSLGIQDTAGFLILQSAMTHLILRAPLKFGRSSVRYQGCQHDLLISRQPLLDAARFLMALGCVGDAVIAMRREGRLEDDIRAPLQVAARLTVDEANGTVFAKWKPFSCSTIALPVRGR